MGIRKSISLVLALLASNLTDAQPLPADILRPGEPGTVSYIRLSARQREFYFKDTLVRDGYLEVKIPGYGRVLRDMEAAALPQGTSRCSIALLRVKAVFKESANRFSTIHSGQFPAALTSWNYVADAGAIALPEDMLNGAVGESRAIYSKIIDSNGKITWKVLWTAGPWQHEMYLEPGTSSNVNIAQLRRIAESVSCKPE